MRRDAERAGLVAWKAVDSLLTVTRLPAPDGETTDAGLPGRVLHAQALGLEQDDAYSQDVLEGPRSIPGNSGQS